MAEGLLAVSETDLSNGLFDGQSIPPKEPAESLDDPRTNSPAPGWWSKGLLAYVSRGIFEPQVKVSKACGVLFHVLATARDFPGRPVARR